MDFLLRNLEALGDEVAAALDDLADEVTGRREKCHVSDGEDDETASDRSVVSGEHQTGWAASDGSTASDTASVMSDDALEPCAAEGRAPADVLPMSAGGAVEARQQLLRRRLIGDSPTSHPIHPPPHPAPLECRDCGPSARGQVPSGVPPPVSRGEWPPPSVITPADELVPARVSPKKSPFVSPPHPAPALLSPQPSSKPIHAPLPGHARRRLPAPRPLGGPGSSGPPGGEDAFGDTVQATHGSKPPSNEHLARRSRSASPTLRPATATRRGIHSVPPPAHRSSDFDLCDRDEDELQPPKEDGEFLIL
jgi:hypothetical protein